MNKLTKAAFALTAAIGLALLFSPHSHADKQSSSEFGANKQTPPSEVDKHLKPSVRELFLKDTNAYLRRGPLSSFIENAENGDIAAQLNLVLRYEMGLSDFEMMTDEFDYDAHDPEKSDYCLMQYWLGRAARTGDVPALIASAWNYGIGVFGKPDAEKSYMYMLKWGESYGWSHETMISYAILLDDEPFDHGWLKKYESWSPEDVPLPPRASCPGCPSGQADQCLAEQGAD